MGVGATIDYEAGAVHARTALDDAHRARVGVPHHHRAASLLAPLPARPRNTSGLLCSLDGLGLYRSPHARDAECSTDPRAISDDPNRHGRPGQDGPVAPRDRARPSRTRARRRLRRDGLPDRHPDQVRRAASATPTSTACSTRRSSTRWSSPRRRSCTPAMVEKALERGLHVFCEKPFVLDVADGERLVALAEAKGARQPGRLPLPLRRRLQGGGAHRRSGALGTVHHVRAEAYGPVVLRPKGGTWRSAKNEGGGALYDYACHAIDLVNFVAGVPDVGRRRRPPRRLLARRGRRDLLHAALRRRRQRPALRQLERRELSQDVDQDLGLGHERPHHRRSPGVPDLPARAARRAARTPARAGRCATRPT